MVVAAVAVAQRLMRFMKKERPLLRQRRPAAYGMCGVWVFYPKLYMPNTINTYLMLWHMKLQCIQMKLSLGRPPPPPRPQLTMRKVIRKTTRFVFQF